MALTVIDRELLRRCLAVEPGGWKNFIDRFVGLFVHVIQHTAYARSVRLSQHDIDDLCAEVLLTFLANDFAVLRQFRGQCSLATYLTVIVRRVVVREMAKRRMAEALGHVTASTVAAERYQPDHDLQRIEDQEEVLRMLEGLPETEAQIVRQYHLEGRSYHEISHGLGIPENSIGPTLTRARAKIRNREMLRASNLGGAGS